MGDDETTQGIAVMTCEAGYAELQHSIKNTFQQLISYTRLLHGGQPTVSRERVEKLIRFMHTLSIMQELIVEDFHQGGDGSVVQLDVLLRRIVRVCETTHAIQCSPIPALRQDRRRAGTVVLILNELLDNAIRHGTGTIQINVSLVPDGGAILTIENDVGADADAVQQSDTEIVFGAGLRLVSLVATSDLKQPPIIARAPGTAEQGFRVAARFKVTVSIPPIA
jgi:two-component sensor histidine kinase